MGCGASTAGASRAAGEPPTSPFDPVAAAAGTWFDPTGATAYDKVLVRLLSDAGDEELVKAGIAVEVPDGGCGKSGAFAFAKNSTTRMCLLMHKRSAGAKQVKVTWGDGQESSGSVSIPDVAAGWVTEHGVLAEGMCLQLRAEPWETKLAAATELEECGMTSHTIELERAKPGEKAVLTYKAVEGNTKLLFWLPGRNDTFMHPHVVAPFLAAGFDLYVLEHRKLGRAQLGCSAADARLFSHTADFRDYLDEFDKGLGFALGRKEYGRVVLYAHSTGGLEASLLLREGAHRARVSACVLNSPFLDWGGVSTLEELMLDSADELFPLLALVRGEDQAELTVLQAATGPSELVTRLWAQYACLDLRCRNGLTNDLTLGWAKASAAMHEELRAMTPTAVPLLLLHTDGDWVLDHTEMPKLARHLSTAVETKFFPNCRHDLLLSYTAEDNEAVLTHILGFLERHT